MHSLRNKSYPTINDAIPQPLESLFYRDFLRRLRIHHTQVKIHFDAVTLEYKRKRLLHSSNANRITGVIAGAVGNKSYGDFLTVSPAHHSIDSLV